MTALSEEKIKSALTKNWDIILLGETDSTNVRAKLLAKSGAVNTAVIAESQTSGHGKFDRPFYSPAGCGIYMSAIISPDIPPSDVSLITPFTSVVCARAVENACSSPVGIKWVNDLYMGGKKICGILTEGVFSPEGKLSRAVIGIGMNVLSTRVPAELEQLVTSVEDETGVRCDRCALIASFLNALSSCSDCVNSRSFIDDYKKRLLWIGRTVSVSSSDGIYTAVVRGIDDDAALIVEANGVTRRLISGEISIKLTE